MTTDLQKLNREVAEWLGIEWSDYTDEFGPFHIACLGCGEETVIWAYPREAWQAWKRMNRSEDDMSSDCLFSPGDR